MSRMEYKGHDLHVRRNKQGRPTKRLYLDGTESGVVGDDIEDCMLEGMRLVDEIENNSREVKSERRERSEAS